MTHIARIARLQQTIQERGLAGALIFYSRDILYYTGTAQPAYLVVRPTDYMLFVRRGYAFAQADCKLPQDRMVAESRLAAVAQRMFADQERRQPVGTELDLLTVNHYRHFQQALDHRLLVDISDAILDQRAVKAPQEIESLRKACAAVHAGHLRILERLRPGISELELAAEIEHAQRIAGHEGVFFMRMPDFVMSRGPLASGPNLRRTSGNIYTITGTGLSSAVPAGPSRRIIAHGDLMMVDIPTCIEGYHADQSRTYAVGQAPDGALDRFARLREVADHLIHRLKPGMTAGEAYAIAKNRADHLGLSDAFLAFDTQPQAHFIGHGVGLEVNEPPLLAANSKALLAEHMVLAIEMHLMAPDGPTLKLEDTVHLTPDGVEILTLSPRELTVVPCD